MQHCLSAAVLVPKATRAPWSASTLASKPYACALAGHKGRFTPLEARRCFFLFRVGAFFVLSRPGYFNEFLATGVLSAACGCSRLFFDRVTLAFSTFGTARAAIFTRTLRLSAYSPFTFYAPPCQQPTQIFHRHDGITPCVGEVGYLLCGKDCQFALLAGCGLAVILSLVKG